MTYQQVLHDTLAAEHVALYLYAVVGSRADLIPQPALRERVQQGFEWHRQCRDELTDRLVMRSMVPPAAEVAYELPNPAKTARQLLRIARQVEANLSQHYGRLVATAETSDRLWAINLLHECARRQIGLGAAPEVFPGMVSPESS